MITSIEKANLAYPGHYILGDTLEVSFKDINNKYWYFSGNIEYSQVISEVFIKKTITSSFNITNVTCYYVYKHSQVYLKPL